MFAAKPGVFLLVGVVGLACAGARMSDRIGCRSADMRPLVTGSDAASLVGEYELWMEATDGPKQGSRATGRLSLFAERRGAATARSDSVVLIGSSELDPNAVGAAPTGDLASRDPMRPGVLVLKHNNDITIRLGAEANRRDVQRFDGAFTALYVTWMSGMSFGGRWASGVQGPDVRGTFCAVRPL